MSYSRQTWPCWLGRLPEPLVTRAIDGRGLAADGAGGGASVGVGPAGKLAVAGTTARGRPQELPRRRIATPTQGSVPRAVGLRRKRAQPSEESLPPCLGLLADGRYEPVRGIPGRKYRIPCRNGARGNRERKRREYRRFASRFREGNSYGALGWAMSRSDSPNRKRDETPRDDPCPAEFYALPLRSVPATSEPLWPPKPKLFDMATAISSAAGPGWACSPDRKPDRASRS